MEVGAGLSDFMRETGFGGCPLTMPCFPNVHDQQSNEVWVLPNLGSDMGDMGDLSCLIDRSIHISRDDRVAEGVEEDIVLLGILGVHEIAFCSTVKKDWSVNDFVACW